MRRALLRKFVALFNTLCIVFGMLPLQGYEIFAADISCAISLSDDCDVTNGKITVTEEEAEDVILNGTTKSYEVSGPCSISIEPNENYLISEISLNGTQVSLTNDDVRGKVISLSEDELQEDIELCVLYEYTLTDYNIYLSDDNSSFYYSLDENGEPQKLTSGDTISCVTGTTIYFYLDKPADENKRIYEVTINGDKVNNLETLESSNRVKFKYQTDATNTLIDLGVSYDGALEYEISITDGYTYYYSLDENGEPQKLTGGEVISCFAGSNIYFYLDKAEGSTKIGEVTINGNKVKDDDLKTLDNGRVKFVYTASKNDTSLDLVLNSKMQRNYTFFKTGKLLDEHKIEVGKDLSNLTTVHRQSNQPVASLNLLEGETVYFKISLVGGAKNEYSIDCKNIEVYEDIIFAESVNQEDGYITFPYTLGSETSIDVDVTLIDKYVIDKGTNSDRYILSYSLNQNDEDFVTLDDAAALNLNKGTKVYFKLAPISSDDIIETVAINGTTTTPENGYYKYELDGKPVRFNVGIKSYYYITASLGDNSLEDAGTIQIGGQNIKFGEAFRALEGSKLNATIFPREGYRIVKVEGDGQVLYDETNNLDNIVGNSYYPGGNPVSRDCIVALSLSGNREIKVTFGKALYKVEFVCDNFNNIDFGISDSNLIKSSDGKTCYVPYGTELRFTAKAHEDYVVSYIGVDDVESEIKYEEKDDYCFKVTSSPSSSCFRITIECNPAQSVSFSDQDIEISSGPNDVLRQYKPDNDNSYVFVLRNRMASLSFRALKEEMCYKLDSNNPTYSFFNDITIVLSEGDTLYLGKNQFGNAYYSVIMPGGAQQIKVVIDDGAPRMANIDIDPDDGIYGKLPTATVDIDDSYQSKYPYYSAGIEKVDYYIFNAADKETLQSETIDTDSKSFTGTTVSCIKEGHAYLYADGDKIEEKLDELSLDLSVLGDSFCGEVFVRAVCTDRAGNVSYSDSETVIINMVDPSVSVCLDGYLGTEVKGSNLYVDGNSAVKFYVTIKDDELTWSNLFNDGSKNNGFKFEAHQSGKNGQHTCDVTCSDVIDNKDGTYQMEVTCSNFVTGNLDISYIYTNLADRYDRKEVASALKVDMKTPSVNIAEAPKSDEVQGQAFDVKFHAEDDTAIVSYKCVVMVGDVVKTTEPSPDTFKGQGTSSVDATYTVKAMDAYNSANSKLVIYVYDSLGREQKTEYSFKMNTVKPEISIEMADSQNSGAKSGFYTARVATITVKDADFTFTKPGIESLLEGSSVSTSGKLTYKCDGNWITSEDDTSIHKIQVEFYADGIYNLALKYTNRAGKTNDGVSLSQADALSFTIDNQKPEVTIGLKPGADQVFGGDVKINYTIKDNIRIKSYVCNVYSDGVLLKDLSKNVTVDSKENLPLNLEYTIDSSKVKGGNITFEVIAYDNSNWETKATLEKLKINPIDPTVSVDVIYDNNGTTTNPNCMPGFYRSYAVRINVDDPDYSFNPMNPSEMVKVTLLDIDGNAVPYNWSKDVSWVTEEENTSRHYLEIKFTEAGKYQLDINYTNKAGHTNQELKEDSKAKLNFTVDATPPSAVLSCGGNSSTTFFGVLTYGIFSNKPYAVTLGNLNDKVSKADALRLYYYINSASEEGLAITAIADLYKNGQFLPMPREGLTIGEDQIFAVYVAVVDEAGNVQYYSTNSNMLDSVGPTVELTPQHTDNGIYGTSYGNKIDVSVHYEDDVATSSGIQKVEYKVTSGGRETDWTTAYVYEAPRSLTNMKYSELDHNGNVTIPVELGTYNNSDTKVTVRVTDNSGNVTEKDVTLDIDVTAPSIEVTYNNNSTTDGGFFNKERTATVRITERDNHFNSSAATEGIRITATDGNGNNISNAYSISSWVTGSSNGDATVHTATITYSADAQYTFDISYTDNAGNTASSISYPNGEALSKKFTVDKTAPVIQVSYDNNAVASGNYYKADRTATVTIVEHNFNPNAVTIKATSGDGKVVPVVDSWQNNGDRHIATVHFATDGVYTLNVTAADMAGNNAEALPTQVFVIDKQLPTINISGVKNNDAYGAKSEVIPIITYSDLNFDKVEIKLKDGMGKDVTADLLKVDKQEDITNGSKITYMNLTKDGYYTLEVTVTDKAGNKTNQTVKFSVNREGSSFEVEDAFKYIENNNLIKQEPLDVKVTERNCNKLVEHKVTIYKGSNKVELGDGDYSFKETRNADNSYTYEYVIYATNFTSDGAYDIRIDTVDEAGNASCNYSETDVDANIRFSIDKTEPNIVVTNVVNGKTYALDTLTAKVNVTDYSLKSVKVYLDDYNKVYREWDSEQINEILSENGEFTFDISGDSVSAHKFKVVCEDTAGNISESEVSNFYVTTNKLVQYYTNKPLFYGSIGGFAALVLLATALYTQKRRKSARR